MSDTADLLEVGRIAKPHGLRGDVVVAPVSDLAQRFAPDAVLVVDGEQRRIERSRKQRDRWVLKLAGIDDRDAAERLRGRLLLAPRVSEAPESGYWVHELIGRRVLTVDGTEVGRIAAVQDNPAHDLLVLDTGPLVPVVFVVDAQGDDVIVDPPEGLLEL